MKHYIIGIALALTLVLALSIAALAETAADPIPDVTEDAAAATDTTPAEDAAPAEEAAPAQADDGAALQEALDAYRAARQDKQLADLEAELSEYVEAGSLTQEQADLILDNVKARIAAKNGECPNCGYQFRNGDGNRARGGKGGRNGQFQNGGQMPRGNQMPDAQSGATPRQGGMQMMPGAGQPQM